jgi:LCP family protein required for cell wall assembly
MSRNLFPKLVKRAQEQSTPLTPCNGAAPRNHHTRRTIVIAALILLVLVVGTGLFYAGCLHETLVSNLKHDALLPTPSAGETTPADPSSAGCQPIESSPATGALNILLIGSDSLTGVATTGRSDAIVLVHISGDRKKVYLVHFPRDMYVNVPGYGKDKINAAFAYGGSQLLIRTLRDLVGVPVDHVALIERKGFILMTDAVGGVDVYAEEASTEFELNVHVGMNHFNGDEAEAFVLERHQLSQGDVSRGRRQQAFLKALMLKILSKETLTNPIRFAALVNAVARHLVVDNAFSISELYADALSLKDLRSDDIVFITAPISGSGTSPEGGWIFIVDEAKLAQLSTALRTDDMSSYVAGQ